MLQKERVQQLEVPYRRGYDAIFNSDFLLDIPEALSQWDCSRILLVASKSMASSQGINHISALQSVLGSSIIDIKIGVGSHSPYPDVQDIALRIQRYQIDCVISVGSCSYSDACKNGSLLAANLEPGFNVDDIEALVDQDRGFADSKDGEPLRTRTCRLIAVPTSLTGGEWNAVGSAVNSKGKKQHFGFWDRGQVDLILLDPQIACTSPEKLWLSGGVRCIDHCVELICNPTSGERGYEGLNVHAEKGFRCMLKGLTDYKKASSEGDGGQAIQDSLLQSISECQYGSREAITGLLIWRVPMGPSHAIGHQLGPLAGIMHGVTSCIMLAPTLRWQAAHSANPHYKKAQAKLLAILNDTLGWQEDSLADGVIRFVKSLGLPTTLKAVNVTSDSQIHELATKTMTDVWGGGKRQLEFKEILDIIESVKG